jgi:hypothetical protein
MIVRLEEPTRKRESEFLTAVRGSHQFFSGWVNPPTQSVEYRAHLKRCRDRPLRSGGS